MKHKAENVLEKPFTKGTCCHHWLIEPATGPVSKGVCKFCGEVREFQNILHDLSPKDDISASFENDDIVFIEEDMEQIVM